MKIPPIVHRGVHDNFSSIPVNCAWHDGVVVTGIVVKKVKEGMRVILKGTKEGKAVVHIDVYEDWVDMVEFLSYGAEKGWFTWRPDRYAN